MLSITDYFMPEYNSGLSRFVFLDVVRAAIIIYIVLIIHGLYFTKAWPGAWKSVLLFEMPLIFLLSGYSYYLFENKHYNGQFHAKHFSGLLFNKAVRILVPYLAYAIGCLALVIVYYEYSGKTYSAPALISTWLNPFSFRLDYMIGHLRYHLWFVPVFFFVSIILPFVAKAKPPPKISIAYIWLISLVIVYINTRLNIGNGMTPYIVFYLIWAYLGYQIARGISIGYVDFLIVCAISAAGLLYVYFKAPQALDMQANKFPPNMIFFLFNSLWISLILLVVSRYKLHRLRYEKTAQYLKPAMLRGYSIYLWQGIPYTIAAYFLDESYIKTILSIIICFFMSILLGVIFGPLEEIRYKSIRK